MKGVRWSLENKMEDHYEKVKERHLKKEREKIARDNNFAFGAGAAAVVAMNKNDVAKVAAGAVAGAYVQRKVDQAFAPAEPKVDADHDA
jgi:hypothetical protein